MGRFGFWELIIILVIILVIFGAGKLPQVMKSLGEGMRSFRKATQDDQLPPTKDTQDLPQNSANAANNNSHQE